MADPPSGTVTFLFTDIEGSTRLWERSPIAMRAALARHNVLLNGAVDRFGGYVFKTMGDAFCAAFATAPDAVAAACAAQSMLANERWPDGVRLSVRMALHTGEAEPQDNDYFGPPLNRAARLLGAGHGAQVLLSHATRELVRDCLPAGVGLRDMGERRLKDLIGPERVYQVIVPGIAADFPPLKTLDARAHNLPAQSTTFIGREREMDELRALLEAYRLVTLTGTGGAGKTRLSLQVAAELIDDYQDGVWFVELAPLSDARLVPQAVATVLGVQKAQADVTATLASELVSKQLLLILDNCEHLVHACALLCQALLSTCPGVRLLCSSREALRIPGETLYRVPSLDTPEASTTVSADALNRFAAARLFVDRAIAVKSTFQIDDKTAAAVASICRQLDGIPLAIELAAARLRSLSVEDIDRRLGQRFRVLTVGMRTALPRQQTLRALIDWSYDLLSDREKALFCRLAVFAGTWSLEAAETVCEGAGVGRDDILDVVTSLADKSLVTLDERNGVVRYRLLETMRQYAHERLRETGDHSRWHERHLAYFLSLAEQAESHLTAADQDAWLDRLDDETDNVRSALAWTSSSAVTVPRGIELAAAFWRFWYMRGMLAEGRATLSDLLAATPAENVSAARAKALSGAGVMAAQQGDYAAARPLYEESLAIRRQLGDRLGIASSLGNLANLAAEQVRFSARAGVARGKPGHQTRTGRPLGNLPCRLAISALRHSSKATMQPLAPAARKVSRCVANWAIDGASPFH